jgi:hypothetical protein
MEFSAKQQGHSISKFFILASNYKDSSIYPKTEFGLVSMCWRIWLKHCATRRKLAGSIPDGVIGNFY